MDNGKWNSNNNNMNEDRDHRSHSPMDSKKNIRGRNSRPSGNSNRQQQNRNSHRSRSPSRNNRRTRAPTTHRIYVANIPYDCKWTGLKDLFREKVGEVSFVELFEDEGGKFRGCGIVEFKDSSSVDKAVDELHRFEFNGRQLVVKRDFDADRDKTGKPVNRSGMRDSRDDSRSNNMGHERERIRDDFGSGLGGRGGGGGGGGGGAQFNTYGLSPQFLDALGITGPLTARVFVANLDYKVTPQKLEEVFRLAGRVVSIDLKRDEDGNSKGHGTVEMGHPVEAVQAISMFKGQKFYNRTMSVRMDKKSLDEADDKRLPEGLQSVGKGLGANGLPLHLNANSGLNNLAPTGLPPVGGLSGAGSTSLSSLMSSQLSPATATGISGLPSIGLSLQERNFTGLGGAGSASTGLLGASAASLSGLGSSLAGGLGSLGAATTGLGGSASLYSDYERSFDRSMEDFRASRTADTLAMRNKLFSSLQEKDLYGVRDYDRSRRR